MFETDWFSGRGVDEPQPKAPARLAWLLFAAIAIGMIAVVFGLAGCASSGICAIKPAGVDENGIAYFFYDCRPQ